MKTVSVEEMRLLDLRATRDFAIPSLQLMENAGKGVAELIHREFGPSKILVCCGKGNNGGDGFVAARYLAQRGNTTQVLLLAEPASLKGDALINFQRLSEFSANIYDCSSNLEKAKSWMEQADIIIDAMLGIGLQADLREPYLSVVRLINQTSELGKTIVAMDVPSGLNSDTGKVMGAAVKADITATMGLPKKGLYEADGPEYSGQIEVIDIGFPEELLV